MKYFILSVISFLLVSCTVYGFSNDYQKLDNTQKSRLIALNDFKETDSINIYKINAAQLKKEVSKFPKSLVYIFMNGCSSESCLPMSHYERFAKQNDYKLFLVMDGFGHLEETTKQRSAVFTSPLFAIDNDYYQSNVRMKYTKYFINELKGNEINAKYNWDGSLFFFENGKLVNTSFILPK